MNKLTLLPLCLTMLLMSASCGNTQTASGSGASPRTIRAVGHAVRNKCAAGAFRGRV